MRLTGRDRINAGGVDAGMPQKIGQSDNILLHTVEGACKEMPQIMRERESFYKLFTQNYGCGV